jgi:neopullulanase
MPAQIVDTPAWVRDAIFYQIFPDRFACSLAVPKPSNLEPWDSPPTSHGFKGGDLLGVVEQLDYLQDLGVNAIYLNPVFRSTANHRYHAHDYYVVDPILGGNQALERLLSEAHRRDMRVVLDGVFNHASRGFYQFSHLLENGPDSPYRDWFIVHSWPLYPYGPADQPAGYESWWNLPALPKFATDVPAVAEFLWGVGEHWIRQGIDGWRLDVPDEIDDDEFWREFRRRIKRTNPEAYIVGEIWGDARRWLAGDQFDAVMNYLFTKACLGFFAAGTEGIDESVLEGTGLFPLDALDASAFRSAIDSLVNLYPWPVTLAQLNILDSHDTARYLTIARGDESSFRLATLFQMTFPGAPCLYYGDEIGIQGGRDPDCRRAFPWDQTLWNEDLQKHVKRCIALRHSCPVLRRGSYLSLYAQDDLYIFARTLGQDIAIVALNAAQGPRTVSVEIPTDGSVADLQSVWDGPAPDIVDGVLRGWQLPARSGSVLLGRTEENQKSSSRNWST